MMNILIVYAHPDPKSFCHAVLQRFIQGLEDAGHTNETIDLYAIGFDPVLKSRDLTNWLPDENAPDVVEKIVKERIFSNNLPLFQRIISGFMFRNKNPLEIVTLLRKRGPKDVREQQAKVARAQALVFISPVWFVGFPAILKGWIERVFTLGFAFSLTSAGWHGDIRGRIPLLNHEKALIINTTIFNETAYQDGLGEAMKKLIDEFTLHYPGIKTVEHVYFYAVNMADEQTRQGYLDRAYFLGKDFAG
jgi:NAD(P)H dehydrogenase (quinone)